MLDFLLQAGQYRADKAQYKIDTAMKKYRNGMTNIANALSQNSITTNTTKNIQQSAKQSVYIKRDALSVAGETEAASAAAMVKGNSVQQALNKVQANASLMDKQRSDDLAGAFDQAYQQRLSSSFSAVQNQDLTYIPKPRFSTYMFKAAYSTAQKAAGVGIGMPSMSQASSYLPDRALYSMNSAGYGQTAYSAFDIKDSRGY